MAIDKLIYIRSICLIVLFYYSAIAFSQEKPDCDLRFIDHLVKSGYYEEALYLLDSTDCSMIQMNDSVNYLRGWSFYSIHRLASSSESFIKIPPTSSFYPESHFYAACNYAQTGSYGQAKDIIDKIAVNTKILNALKNYELSGIVLLQGDHQAFDKLTGKSRFEQPEIRQSSDNLVRISEDMKNHKSKSPFVAGLLSGIIPGSGKLYAGRKGEAAAMFLSNVSLGLITWENYRKSGLKSFRTIAFGSLLAVTYVANIYGSVFSVTVIENDYRENVKNSILFNMHIPLNAIFK